MKLILYFISILLSISFNGFSQGFLTGKIIDKNQNPIAFANIYLPNSTVGSVSNEWGEFSLQYNIPTDTLIITHIAYENKKISIKNNNNPLVISLVDKAVYLNEITIYPSKPTINLIIDALKENYPISERNHTYQLVSLVNKVQAQDPLILSYFDGQINLKTSSYIGEKKQLNAFLINNSINLNNYKKVPDFYFTSPQSILKKFYPENLPFIAKKEKYNFHEEQMLDEETGKLSFEPKQNEKFTYKGYLYYNVINFSILYVEMALTPNPENKGKLIAIGFGKSASETIFNKESYKIQYSLANTKYELDKFIYISLTSFNSKKENYTICSNLNLINMNTREHNSNLKKLNLYELKTSKSNKATDVPYINPLQRKIIEKIIEEESKKPTD